VPDGIALPEVLTRTWTDLSNSTGPAAFRRQWFSLCYWSGSVSYHTGTSHFIPGI